MGYITEYHFPGEKLTYTAGGTITGGQLVAFTDDGIVSVAGADSVLIAGVAIEDATIGKPVTVATAGIWPITASGGIAEGVRVVSGATGTVKAVPAASGSYTLGETTIPYRIVGICQSTVTDGQTAKIKLIGL